MVLGFIKNNASNPGEIFISAILISYTLQLLISYAVRIKVTYLTTRHSHARLNVLRHPLIFHMR